MHRLELVLEFLVMCNVVVHTFVGEVDHFVERAETVLANHVVDIVQVCKHLLEVIFKAVNILEQLLAQI